jgi:hypothetical protein
VTKKLSVTVVARAASTDKTFVICGDQELTMSLQMIFGTVTKDVMVAHLKGNFKAL